MHTCPSVCLWPTWSSMPLQCEQVGEYKIKRVCLSFDLSGRDRYSFSACWRSMVSIFSAPPDSMMETYEHYF